MLHYQRHKMSEEKMTKISLDDVKFDLLKIIEPYDGTLSENQWGPVYNKFNAYMNDLCKEHIIVEHNVRYTVRNDAITYDVSIKMAHGRAIKKLKIHVGKFKYPWIQSA